MGGEVSIDGFGGDRQCVSKHLIAIRVDATERIGSGHLTRCSAIAEALCEVGCEVVFVASCSESARAFRERGYACEVIPCDPCCFTEQDAENLFGFCASNGIEFVLFDTYGVTSEFMTAWRGRSATSMKTGLIDDMFTYPDGLQASPKLYDADLVIGGDAFFSESNFERVYAGCDTVLLIGPRYIPIRSDLPILNNPAGSVVDDIMITSGSTNPDGALERMSLLAKEAIGDRDIRIHVVVGPRASFGGDDDGLILHTGEPIVDIMKRCQVAFSSAGITLLELMAMGIPTLAFELVENQRFTVQAFSDRELGFACSRHEAESLIVSRLNRLLSDADLRAECSARCRALMDGKGALRIAHGVLGCL